MGYIPSSSTNSIYAVAYLTQIGRNYLFNKNNIRFDANGNDLFAITSFTLGDPDTNYQMNYILGEGEVPDVSGNSDQPIKSCADSKISTFLYYQVNALSFVTPVYNSSLTSNNNILSINTNNASNFPVNSASDVPPTTGSLTNSTSGGGTLTGAPIGAPTGTLIQ